MVRAAAILRMGRQVSHAQTNYDNSLRYENNDISKNAVYPPGEVQFKPITRVN